MVEEAKVQMKDSAPRMKAKKMAKPAPSPSKMASPASAGSISRNITSKRKESLFTQKQFGKIPVKIQIPLVGTANYFEKLFIENEQIELNFNYKRSKKDEVEGI
jgi:hypothetical protein